MNDNLKSFYYSILNIRKYDSSLDIIKEEIEKLKKYLEENEIDTEHMCIAISRLLSNKLEERGISNKVINTKELFDCYEHEFILAHYNKGEDIECILIDLTYSQFDSKNKKLITDKMNKFPTEILKESNVLSNLLQDGYSVVNDQEFKTYLYSIHQNENLINEFSLDDIIYKGILK